MTLLTSPDNLPYPDDYGQPADVPLALKDLADATQATFLRDRTPTPRRIYTRPEDVGVPSGTLAVLAGWQAMPGTGQPDNVFTYLGSGRVQVNSPIILDTTIYTAWAAHGSGERRIELHNKDAPQWRDNRSSPGAGTLSTSVMSLNSWPVEAGAILSVKVLQSSGTTLTFLQSFWHLRAVEPWV